MVLLQRNQKPLTEQQDIVTGSQKELALKEIDQKQLIVEKRELLLRIVQPMVAQSLNQHIIMALETQPINQTDQKPPTQSLSQRMVELNLQALHTTNRKHLTAHQSLQITRVHERYTQNQKLLIAHQNRVIAVVDHEVLDLLADQDQATMEVVDHDLEEEVLVVGGK